MKDKPTPWGIKLYELCESKSAYAFEIYAAEPDISNKPTDVVLRIMAPLLDKGYYLYTDNYYSCPDLCHKLVTSGTHCTGTVRSNRRGMPFPADLKTNAVGDTAY